MRIAAILANLCVLGEIAILLARYGLESTSAWLLIIPMILAPVLSLIALLTCIQKTKVASPATGGTAGE